MATYTSKPQAVSRPAEELFERFSDLSHLQGALDTLTEEQRAQIGSVHFSADSISIVTPQVGEIAFHVTDRVRPSKVVFGTKSSPVPLFLWTHLALCPHSHTPQAQVLGLTKAVSLLSLL